ncbi:hypothetical protein JOB18_026011 [Solea senegalensis]|uniref:Uncharacterized protein n=1 Tax=Solea senegalensis TaxID=28829 RepID=A0AAV6Q9Y3_SOLSE|nr:hypothetical protein JOB18_026011 [Solea senegalensis]
MRIAVYRKPLSHYCRCASLEKRPICGAGDCVSVTVFLDCVSVPVTVFLTVFLDCVSVTVCDCVSVTVFVDTVFLFL